MTAHYVLCVGGSGAKGGEALIHLLAAGVGTAKTVIHFLDQDVTNGNLIKTRRLADLYQDLHKALRPALDKFDNQWLFRAPLNENGEAEVFPPVHPPFERLGQLFERDLCTTKPATSSTACSTTSAKPTWNSSMVSGAGPVSVRRCSRPAWTPNCRSGPS